MRHKEARSKIRDGKLGFCEVACSGHSSLQNCMGGVGEIIIGLIAAVGNAPLICERSISTLVEFKCQFDFKEKHPFS